MKQFQDSLQLAAGTFPENPVFCVDGALDIEKDTSIDYIHGLEKAVGFDFHCIKCVKKGLNQWIQTFAEHGAATAAHVLDSLPFAEASDMELTGIFKKAMGGQALSVEEIAAYKTGLLLHCARQYAKQNMAMEIYVSCPACAEGPLAQLRAKLDEAQPRITLLSREG